MSDYFATKTPSHEVSQSNLNKDFSAIDARSALTACFSDSISVLKMAYFGEDSNLYPIPFTVLI